MTFTKSEWIKVSRARPCDICGKPDYCTRTADGTTVKCMRVASDHVVHNKDLGDGWLHKVADHGLPAVPAVALPGRAKMKTPEIVALLKQHRTALSPRALSLAATRLHVSEASLLAYGAGADPTTGNLSFPMYDGDLNPIGIHLRRDDGTKRCVVGSRNGLFVPSDYADARDPGRVGRGVRRPAAAADTRGTDRLLRRP